MKNAIFFVVLSLFIFVENSLALTFNVTVPAGTYECWIAGNFKTDVNLNWDINTYKMAKIDDTHFTIDIPDAIISSAGLTYSSIRYKYLSGPSDWAFVEKNAAGNDIAVRTYNNKDVIFKWGTICKTAVIRIITPKTVTECYLTGSFNNWAIPGANGTKMNYDAELSDALGNNYYLVIHTANLSTLTYQFAAGPSVAYLQTQSALSYSASSLCGTAYYDNITFKRIFNSTTTKTVILNTIVPVGTSAVYLMGSQVLWDGVRWLAGTQNFDGTFTFTVNNVDIMQYKYYNTQNWIYNEVDANNVDKPDRTADAQISTTYNDLIVKWKNNVINNIVKTDNQNIYIDNKKVNIKNINNRIKVFDFSGRAIIDEITQGSFTTKALNSGLYIFQIDNKAYKIFVR